MPIFRDIRDILGILDINDSGALSSVNLLRNHVIGDKQAQALVKIKESMPNLKTLCGLTMEETRLDFSCQRLGSADAIFLASDIEDSGVLSELDLSKNQLDSDDLSTVSEALKSTSIKQLNIADNFITCRQISQRNLSFLIKFAKDMKDMGSLVSLNIANDDLRAEGAKHLAEGLLEW
jgi:hypothetical protein